MSDKGSSEKAWGSWMNEIARLAKRRWGPAYRGFDSQEQWEDWWERGLSPEQVLQEMHQRFGVPVS